jgi:regulation of enolase protein 1 (concanavalin A-like superfamily)
VTLRLLSGTRQRLAAACLFFGLCSQAWADDPWQSGDIGTVGVAGSSSYDELADIYTIRGSGENIWDTADSFHYVYQTVEGDAELIAHLGSLENTSEWARAGLMVRQDKSVGSVWAMMCQTSLRGDQFEYRLTANAGCNQINTQNNGAPIWLRVVKDGNIVSGYDSTDGIHWTCRGAVRLPFNGPIMIGMAVCSHTKDSRCEATFDHITLNSGHSFSPPSPWVEQEVGATSIPGGTHWENNECNIFATGKDIRDNADSFHYLSQPLNGDGYIVARVEHILALDSGAKAGIMLRENNAAGSQQVSLLLTPDDGAYFLRRATLDAKGAALSFSAQGPLWLKLVRQGNTFTASVSIDGAVWKLIGKDEIPMDDPINVGLVLSPKNTNSLGEASFDHVTVGTGLPADASP